MKNMQVIEEGRHRFEFPEADGWFACKYDETDFYRQRVAPITYRYDDVPADARRKGEGIRGVDIIAHHGQELTLMEIKDFSEDAAGLEAKVASNEIPAVIAQKALHTWGALCLGARNGDDLLPPDLRASILMPPTRLRVILFLAQEPIRYSPREKNSLFKKDARLRQRLGIRTKLLNLLRPLGMDGDLADVGDLPRHCGWAATEVA